MDQKDFPIYIAHLNIEQTKLDMAKHGLNETINKLINEGTVTTDQVLEIIFRKGE